MDLGELIARGSVLSAHSEGKGRILRTLYEPGRRATLG
jgi:hypothetical protein